MCANVPTPFHHYDQITSWWKGTVSGMAHETQHYNEKLHFKRSPLLTLTPHISNISFASESLGPMCRLENGSSGGKTFSILAGRDKLVHIVLATTPWGNFRLSVFNTKRKDIYQHQPRWSMKSAMHARDLMTNISQEKLLIIFLYNGCWVTKHVVQGLAVIIV